jgi:2-C-methyl-D-erythritol 4-phosphate cytidylyltransferase
MKENVIAIVPAAGLGTRFGPGTNKPFHPLLDKPLIVWSLEVFETLDEIREVIPVLKEEDMEMGRETFERYNLSKVKRIAPGGQERQDSVYHGLRLLKGNTDMVLIHDGARPLINSGIVRTTIRSVAGFDGVIVGVPVKDTIKEVRDGIVKGTLKRDTMWAVQTPQLFLYDALMKAYQRALEERFYSTDDSALIERNGGKVRVIMGSYSNIKITTPEDVTVAEFLLRDREKAG